MSILTNLPSKYELFRPNENKKYTVIISNEYTPQSIEIESRSEYTSVNS